MSVQRASSGAHLWLTYLSVVSKMGGSLLGRLIRGLWEIACSWALIFSACLRSFLALRMAGTPLRSRWAAFLCHSSYLGYLLGFLGTSYCGEQAKVGRRTKRGRKKNGVSSLQVITHTHTPLECTSTPIVRETPCLFSAKHSWLAGCRWGASQMEMKAERHNSRASPATSPCFGFRG